VRVFLNRTSASDFDVLGVPLVRGRPYTPEEVAAAAPVAVISAALARRYWGMADPIGETLGRVDDAMRSWQVVGIVADAMAERLDNEKAEVIYRPLASSKAHEAHLLIRFSGNATQAVGPAQAVLRSIDTALRPEVDDARSREREGPRRMAFLTGSVGLVSLVLASLGVYGVTAFLLGRRKREISIRISLGARKDLARLLVRDSLQPVAIGLLAGLVVVMRTSHLVASALYGISARDPLSLLGATALLLVSALIAVVLPARRALRVSPAEVLTDS
jgi:ABC-type antimicrobial peptide transport system permease subunit